MRPVITFGQLVTHIERGTLSPDGLRQAFVLDPTTTTAFHPRFKINPEFVDISALPVTAAACGNALAIEASAAMERQVSRRAAAVAASIIAEGDSWFRLPRFLYPKTMADVLADQFPILNLAHWGDELSSMYNDGRGQLIPFLEAGGIRVVMISGGGNDILGETLEESLRIFDPSRARPEDASLYPTPFFFERVDGLMRIYTALLEQIQRISPGTVVLAHGYDYAVPRENGIFLGVHLARRGLHPLDRPELCNAIVRWLVDHFNKRLAGLEARHANLRYVDLRNTVREDEWFDQELHPSASAAERLAGKIAPVLRRVFDTPVA